MLTKRIIPCLDILNGQVVKGVNFVGIKEVGDAVQMGRKYCEDGADELVFLDIGKPRFVTADMVSEGAAVIDVGVNRDPQTGKLCGDVDFEAIEPKASVITPVPGGVGPMTICCLMENTIECFLRRQ